MIALFDFLTARRVTPYVASCALLLCSGFVFVQSQKENASPFSQFRPRQELTGEVFVGREACASCHIQKSRSDTEMERALVLGHNSRILAQHQKLNFQFGKYSWEISTAGGSATYRASDGERTITEPIAFAFGDGHVAQTFVLRRNGKFYEGRVSYYSGINSLDWTLGDAMNPPPSLEEAFGRDISGDEARNCFSCHATSTVVDGKLNLDRMIPGVGCEACHGPGGRHVHAMRSGSGEDIYIFNPKTLDPDTLSQQFCGACHRSADEVGMMPNLGGINNVRFQPYRMSNSRGHQANDRRFSCVACHDPHLNLNPDPISYDSKCMTCHRSGSALTVKNKVSSDPKLTKLGLSKVCPVAKNHCVTCHMPKVELPAAHFRFTDHRIRIVRAGEKYPI